MDNKKTMILLRSIIISTTTIGVIALLTWLLMRFKDVVISNDYVLTTFLWATAVFLISLYFEQIKSFIKSLFKKNQG